MVALMVVIGGWSTKRGPEQAEQAEQAEQEEQPEEERCWVLTS